MFVFITTGVFKSLVNPRPHNFRYIVITKNYGIMKKLIQRIMLWLGSWPKDKVLESQGSEEADWAADIVGTTLGTIIVTVLML